MRIETKGEPRYVTVTQDVTLTAEVRVLVMDSESEEDARRRAQKAVEDDPIDTSDMAQDWTDYTPRISRDQESAPDVYVLGDKASDSCPVPAAPEPNPEPMLVIDGVGWTMANTSGDRYSASALVRCDAGPFEGFTADMWSRDRKLKEGEFEEVLQRYMSAPDEKSLAYFNACFSSVLKAGDRRVMRNGAACVFRGVDLVALVMPGYYRPGDKPPFRVVEMGEGGELIDVPVEKAEGSA